jgi:hypothetical protein
VSFKYKEVVPWGRSFEEYIRMFHLTDEELNLKILGCSDEPASFNSEMNKIGKRVISVDPIYRLNAKRIRQRINDTYDNVISQTYHNRNKFNWESITSVEELGRIRMESMCIFLADYEKGKIERRYLQAELPYLPFNDNDFDLVLSSHFLFLYSENLSLKFHLDSIHEMCRVAKEVWIFPLLDVNAVRSIHLDHIIIKLQQKGKIVFEQKVNYEFQKGGNKVLIIQNP